MSYTAKDLIENTRIYEKNWLILEYAEKNKLKAIKDLCLEIERKLEDRCVEIQKSLGVYVDGNKIRDHHKSPYKKRTPLATLFYELMSDMKPRSIAEIKSTLNRAYVHKYGCARASMDASKKYGVAYLTFKIGNEVYYQQGVIDEPTQERKNTRIVA